MFYKLLWLHTLLPITCPFSDVGGLPVLVVAMQQDRELATAAHEMISLLLDTAIVPASQLMHTAAVLAHLQVLHHYSGLLTPIKTDVHPENIAGFFAGEVLPVSVAMLQTYTKSWIQQYQRVKEFCMRFSLSVLYNLHATKYCLRLDHCAFWLTDMHRLSCVSGSKAFSACWVNDEDKSDLHQVAFVQAVASSMTKVAMYSPHRTGSLTEASWQPVKTIVLYKIAFGARWLSTVQLMNAAMQDSMSAEDEEIADRLAECKQQLWTLMHVVLTHHLPNRQLDMTEVINIVLVPVIQDYALISSKRPSGALALALLKRASEDKAVFAQAPANEEFWDSTVSTVSLLWTVSCKLSSGSVFLSVISYSRYRLP